MTSNHAVVVVGAGPTGMTLAAELTLAQVDVVVVERRAGPELESARAGGLHARSIEAFDQRGIAERFVSEEPPLGTRQDALGVHGIGRLDYEIVDGKVVFAEEGPVRVTVTTAEVQVTGEPTLDDLREALVSVYGTDFGVHSPRWISRFT